MFSAVYLARQSLSFLYAQLLPSLLLTISSTFLRDAPSCWACVKITICLFSFITNQQMCQSLTHPSMTIFAYSYYPSWSALICRCSEFCPTLKTAFILVHSSSHWALRAGSLTIESQERPQVLHFNTHSLSYLWNSHYISIAASVHSTGISQLVSGHSSPAPTAHMDRSPLRNPVDPPLSIL